MTAFWCGFRFSTKMPNELRSDCRKPEAHSALKDCLQGPALLPQGRPSHQGPPQIIKVKVRLGGLTVSG